MRNRPKIIRYSLQLIVAVLVTVVCACPSTAGWKLIFSNPLPGGYGFRCSYFLDELNGFIAGDVGDGIFKTTDGGKTWKIVKLNPGPSTRGDVTAIRMTDALNGWVTVEVGEMNHEPNPPGAGVYRTTDGGLSWNLGNYRANCTDVYETPSAVTVTSREALPQSGPILTAGISTNGGATFKTGSPFYTNGIDFTDALHGIAVCYHDTTWYRTTNGGVSWSSLAATDRGETWSVYGAKGTTDFYTAGENDDSKTGIASQVRRSIDNGATWAKISNLPFRTTGHIAGVGEMAIYVQVDIDDPIGGNNGLFRSTDAGRTWVAVGGPGNARDTRFSVLGCRGEVVYAFDKLGNVWKTDDGGDGALAPFALPKPIIALSPFDACDTKDTTITIRNTGCESLSLLNASTPASNITITTAAGSPIVYPIIIAPNGSYQLKISVLGNAVGSFSSPLKLSLEKGSVPMDTTLQIQTTIGNPLPVSFDESLKFNDEPICGSLDSILSVFNPSCDSFKIVSVSLQAGTSFSLLNVAQTDTIAPGATRSIGIRFSPQTTGPATDYVLITGYLFGVKQTVKIPISGNGSPDSPQFLFSLGQTAILDFDTLSRCDTAVTIPFSFTNPGCTYIDVTYLDVVDSNGNAVARTPGYLGWTPLAATRKIHGTDTLRSQLTLIPNTLGLLKGFVKVKYNIEGQSAHIAVIPYQAFVIPGSKLLSVDTSNREYGAIHLCETRDTLITITNEGCEPLTLDSTVLSGASFAFLNVPGTGIVIAPGKSLSIPIRFIPVTSGVTSGQLTIFTDADSNSVRTVLFSGSAIPVDTFAFRAVSLNSAPTPGDTMTVAVTPSRSFANKGLTSIDLEFRYNGDIMTPIISSARTSMANATVVVKPEIRIGSKYAYLPITITGPNLAIDSLKSIVSVRFRITLSDSNQSGFRIESFMLNNNSKNFNTCVLGAAIDTSSVGLAFSCGENLIYQYMQTNTMDLNGIAATAGEPFGEPYPNPVPGGGILRIPYTTLRDVTARIQILDGEGRTVLTLRQSTRGASRQLFIVPIAALPSGTYRYSLTSESPTQADTLKGILGQFVIVK